MCASVWSELMQAINYMLLSTKCHNYKKSWTAQLRFNRKLIQLKP